MEDVMYKIYRSLFDSQKELNIQDVNIYTDLENEPVVEYKKDKTVYIITNVETYQEK